MKCGFQTYAFRTLHPEWTWLDRPTVSRKSLDPCTWLLFGEPCTWLFLWQRHHYLGAWEFITISCDVRTQRKLNVQRCISKFSAKETHLRRLKLGAMAQNSFPMNPQMVILRPLDYPILEVENCSILKQKQRNRLRSSKKTRNCAGLSRSHNLPPIQNNPSNLSRNWFQDLEGILVESDGFLYQTLSSFQAPHCLDPIDPLAVLISKMMSTPD